MALTAVVTKVMTCRKYHPNDPIDVVFLSHQKRRFSIETPVGQLTQGQTVNVKATRVSDDGVPMFLELVS